LQKLSCLLLSSQTANGLSHIENKTLGAAVGKQLQLYLDVKDYLTGQGWEAQIHLLISVGYETEREWKMIEQNSVPLILWEDVLSVIDQIEG
jgi:hypothetical protein